jgi:hypothetical protein
MKIKKLSGLAYFLLLTHRLHMILSRAARQSFFQEILGASLRIVLYSVSPYRQSKLDEGFLFLYHHPPSLCLSLRLV